MQSPGWHSVLITEAAVGHVWHCGSEIQGLHTRKKYKFYLLFILLKKRKYFANEKRRAVGGTCVFLTRKEPD